MSIRRTPGPAGIAIPIGLPLLVVIGYYVWKDAAGTGTEDKSGGDVTEPNDAPLAATARADSSGDD